jgi:hypothetical protein
MGEANMKHRAQRVGVAAVVGPATCAATAFMTAAPAVADGACGQDYAGSTACPILTPGGPFRGTVVAENDTDYYVFHAVENTHLSVSILDTEPATYSTTSGQGYCGDVGVELYDAKGDNEGGPGKLRRQTTTSTSRRSGPRSSPAAAPTTSKSRATKAETQTATQPRSLTNSA